MSSQSGEAADHFEEHPWHPDRITNQNSIQQGSSRESSSRSASQKFFRRFNAVTQEATVGSYANPDESSPHYGIMCHRD
jgi:hypothetical protein